MYSQQLSGASHSMSSLKKKIIDRYHRVSEHKRSGINVFKQIDE